MQNLLIPIDGSTSSIHALEAAIDLAASIGGAKLYVINVQMPILSGNVTRFFSAEDIQGYYQDEGRNALAPAQPVLDTCGLEYTQEVVVGPIAMTIVEYAKKHDCHHIFMGKRGPGLVKGLVLGSVTTKVISLADMPVTLVK